MLKRLLAISLTSLALLGPVPLIGCHRSGGGALPDLDNDGTPDQLDPDIDGDGVLNAVDAFPLRGGWRRRG